MLITTHKNIQYLDVYLQGFYIGKLSSTNGELSFFYDREYVKKRYAVKLSISLPLQTEPFGHNVVFSFFSGLLPDEGVRYHLARYLGLSEKNTFALLKEIGGECAGAVSLYPEGITPGDNLEHTYRILDDTQADELFSHLDKRPMMVGEDDIRISGAGAQNKMMIAFVDGKIAIPTHNTPSTHILKPAIKGLEETVQNEFFCMRLAHAINLPVPHVEIFWINKRPYYLIERYDRIKGRNGLIQRLHQEDFCQAMHFAPELKYEAEGGPTLESCFALLDDRIHAGAMAGKNKITLLQGVLFNFLIGNGDAHGKNFSLLYQHEAESLAPFYDLMSTSVYGNAYKMKMAMKISGKYKHNDITLRHWLQFFDNIGFRVNFAKRQIMTIVEKTLKESPDLCKKLNRELETASPIYEKIVEIIKTNGRKVTNSI